mmetsp:Transcript_26430/g.27472  ORF Transcript_26430/g.27472 Transcript_26430/m.27472 type:complete len:228 (-) Transcript_26430:309-992(-)
MLHGSSYIIFHKQSRNIFVNLFTINLVLVQVPQSIVALFIPEKSFSFISITYFSDSVPNTIKVIFAHTYSIWNIIFDKRVLEVNKLSLERIQILENPFGMLLAIKVIFVNWNIVKSICSLSVHELFFFFTLVDFISFHSCFSLSIIYSCGILLDIYGVNIYLNWLDLLFTSKGVIVRSIVLISIDFIYLSFLFRSNNCICYCSCSCELDFIVILFLCLLGLIVVLFF